METTKEPSKLQPLLVEDAQWILSRLPKELRSVLKEAAEGGIIAFVCGGFIRACIAGETVSDIDIIITDGRITDKAVKIIEEAGVRLIIA